MADEEKPAVVYRIDDSMRIVLFVFAVFFDVLSLVPGLNILVAIIGGGTMGLFFGMNGVSVFSQKIAVRYWGRLLLELIPFISWIPAFVWSTFAVVEWSRVEDKHKILRLAEQAVAIKAFKKKSGPMQPGKEMDNEVAALADKRAGNVERRGGAAGAPIATGLRNYANDTRKLNPEKEPIVGKPGLSKADVTPGAITKTDFAKHQVFNQRPAERKAEKRGGDNFSGVNQGGEAGENNERTVDRSDNKTKRTRSERKLSPEEAENTPDETEITEISYTNHANTSQDERESESAPARKANSKELEDA